MPTYPLIGPVLGVAGNILGAKKKGKTAGTSQATTATTATSATTGTSAATMTPTEPLEFQSLRDLLISEAMERLRTPSALGPGFEAEGIQNINRGSDLARQSLENRLGGAGLLGSGIHGAGLTNLETARFSNLGRLQNIDIPRLEREFRAQDVDEALRIFGQRRTGTETTGETKGTATGETTGTTVGTTTGTAEEGGNPLGVGLSSAAELLGELYGAGELAGDVAGGVGKALGLGGGAAAAAPLASTLAGTVGAPISQLGTAAAGTGALSGTGLVGPGSLAAGAGTAAAGTGAAFLGAGTPAFGTTLATGALTPAAPGFAGAGAGAGGAGGAGITGSMAALATNPLTWIAAGGLGAALVISKIGRGRKTADRIKPTQNQVTQDLGQANEAFWKGHAAGQVTSAEHVQNYLNQLEAIRKSFFDWVGGVKGDERAKKQARETIGGLIDQMVQGTRAAFAPYGMNPAA